MSITKEQEDMCRRIVRDALREVLDTPDNARVRELEGELAKSVCVPDGWLLLKPDTVNYHIGWLGKYYAVVDPETMPATTTQSKLDDCEACLDDCNSLVAELRKSLQDERTFAEKKQSEIKRLRKAIETHRDNFPDEPMDGERLLWSALTPPTAAVRANHPGEPPDDSGDWVYSQTRGHWVKKDTYPSPAASSVEECGAINPEWLTKMAEAEDAAGDVSIGTSAPAAESGVKNYCVVCGTKWEYGNNVPCPKCFPCAFTTDSSPEKKE